MEQTLDDTFFLDNNFGLFIVNFVLFRLTKNINHESTKIRKHEMKTVYFFFVIVFFRVFVIILFVSYEISKFMLAICQPFAAALIDAFNGNPFALRILSACR